MITFPITGQLNWDVPLNDQLGILGQSGFNPNDYGLLAYNYAPLQIAGGATAVSGQIRMIRLPALPESTTITSVAVHIAQAPVGITAGQNFIGLYSAAGSLLAQTADATTPFTTTGSKVIALTAPYVAAAGSYYLGILTNAATTTPAFGLCSSFSASAVNFNLSAADSHFGNGATGLTTLPANVTMASLTQSTNATFIGVA